MQIRPIAHVRFENKHPIKYDLNFCIFYDLQAKTCLS